MTDHLTVRSPGCKLLGMPPVSDVIVVGSINADLVIKGPRLPAPGETILGGEFYQAAGGKGANQAVAAARLANNLVTFVGAVGDDALGRDSLRGFQYENLICDYLKIIAQAPTGVALILVDRAGQNLISVASGANAQLEANALDAVCSAAFATARVFLTSLEIPLETVASGLKRAKQAGLLTVLNPAPASHEVLGADLLRWVDVLTPNAGEAALLAETDLAPAGDSERAAAIRAARKLQERGCQQVIVTLGADGCVVVGSEVTQIAPCRVTAVDATAAGDAFNGALAVALAEGQALAVAARWANAAAALSVTRRGAQPSLPTRRELEEFLARNR